MYVPNVPSPKITCEDEPAPVTVNVPEVVIGEPDTENAAGIDNATDVTEPPLVPTVCHDEPS